MVAGSKNLESSILKQVQHDGMRYSPNNLRQSFQSRILNFVFDLLLGFYGGRWTDDGQRGFHQRTAFSGSFLSSQRVHALPNVQPSAAL
ncbi:hypothetical protein V511_09725 [Mesotoga sp. Brook.08.YT.4.2.5.1]|nr:hypothetical protein V511_09725 [Mesotoga sp. Brook.08.YT.4.2.5.1]RAO96439.1 hypothetical protein M388_14490 [Mesotoga sp. Brook.08.YT.4.2.5.4.]RDI93718.1 hypothetical protein Q502_04060 [Mesotoga sp. Brook.08.YT.4.2.5.2.]